MKPRYFRASALGFPRGEESPPAVVAQGEYALADMIVDAARRLGVPVVEEDALSESLSQVEVGEEIPSELFEAAAAILAEVGAISAGPPKGPEDDS
jgi:type III secretion system FlhB-like substrate exporter